MALPKRRHSKARKRKRRSHDALTAPGYTNCTHCGTTIMSHAICAECGYYKDKSVVTIKEKKAKAKKT